MTDLIFTSGPALAILGATLAAFLGGIGSSIGSGKAGQAAAGVSTEKPELWTKMMILEALPGSQGIYGLIIVFLVAGKFDDFSSIDAITGASVFFACLPAALTGLFSGVYQGKVAAAGAQIIAKNPDKLVSAIVFAAIIETFALLGLLGSIILLGKIGV